MKPVIFTGITVFVAATQFAAAAAEPANRATTTVTTAPVPAALAGALFFSDGDRAKLDKARRSGGAVELDAPEPPPSVINGVVKRGDGSTSVWVDGRMLGPLAAVIAAKVTGGAVGHPEGLRIGTNETIAIRAKSEFDKKAKPQRKPASKRHKQ